MYSAFRLVKRAADAGKRVAVINLGETRAERSGLELLKVRVGVFPRQEKHALTGGGVARGISPIGRVAFAQSFVSARGTSAGGK